MGVGVRVEVDGVGGGEVGPGWEGRRDWNGGGLEGAEAVGDGC